MAGNFSGLGLGYAFSIGIMRPIMLGFVLVACRAGGWATAVAVFVARHFVSRGGKVRRSHWECTGPLSSDKLVF